MGLINSIPVIKKQLKNFWRGWARQTITETGLFRLALGTYLLYYYLTLLPDLLYYFGPNGMVQPSLLPKSCISLLFVVWTPSAVVILFTLMMILILWFTAGLLNKKVFLLLIILQASFYNANPSIINESQPLANLFLLSFLFLPLNAPPVFFPQKQRSFDEKQLREAKQIVNLLIFFMGLYYFMVGIKKLPDPLWRGGEAVHYLVNWIPIKKNTILAQIIRATPLLAKGMTYGTLCFELSFIFLIFTKLRPLLIIVGMMIHLGINLALEVGTLSQIMMVSYALLLDERTRGSYAPWWQTLQKIKPVST